MVKIFLNKQDDSIKWKNLSFKELSIIENKIVNDIDIDITYSFFQFLQNKIKFSNFVYVNDEGFLNFYVLDDELQIFPIEQKDLNKDKFLFVNQTQRIQKIFLLNNTSSLYNLQSQLSLWKGEQTIKYSPMDNELTNFLKKWASIFDVQLLKYQKRQLVGTTIKHFDEFAKLKFHQNISWKKFKIYENPDITNKTLTISQDLIINSIIDNALLAANNKEYSDHFITAPTGAGKSLIFQSVAYYLSQNMKLLTIIVSPLSTLMKNQMSLFQKIYNKVATINAELNFVDRQDVITKIQEGDIDIVYVTLETLLSTNFQNLFGDRKLGLLVVDKVHVATTWGKGFRPNYWYLDRWIHFARKTNGNFEIATFTATSSFSRTNFRAMNLETETHLTMKNTIEIIAPAYRDDIVFDITHEQRDLKKEEYSIAKKDFIISKLKLNKKTIIYFPYSAQIWNFSSFLHSKNIPHVSYEGTLDVINKKDNLAKFQNNSIKVMLATKAFGMGIGIDNIEMIIHYAPTGFINDYLQEIDCAARRENIEGIATIKSIFPNNKGTSDLTFINKLDGMSAINNYHIQNIAQIIKRIYEKTNENKSSLQKGLLISMDNFTTISFDENKVKTAFLMLQRDLEKKFTYTGIVIRPSTILTEIIVEDVRENFNAIQNKIEFKSQIDNYFNKKIFDKFYQLDFERLWKTEFSEISFPTFQFLFFGNSRTVYVKKTYNQQLLENIHKLKKIVNARQIITFDCNNIEEKINNSYYVANKLMTTLLANGLKVTSKTINGVSKKFQMSKFTIIEFLNSLLSFYSFLDKKGNGIGLMVPLRKREDSYIFKKKHNIIQPLYLHLLSLIKERKKKDSTYVIPMTIDKDSGYQRWIYEIKIFEILGYFSAEFQSGFSPKVYINVNSPTAFDFILRENYSNYYVEEAFTKFRDDKEVMKKFLTKTMNLHERRNFIENHFLFKNSQYK